MWPCSPDPIKSQINPPHALPSNFFKTLFNIILPSTTWPYKSTLSSSFPHQNGQCISLTPQLHILFRPADFTSIHQYRCYSLFNASKGGYCWLSSCNNFWHFLCLRCPTQRTDTLWYQTSDIRLFSIQKHKIQSTLTLKFHYSTRFYTCLRTMYSTMLQHTSECCYSIMRLCSVQHEPELYSTKTQSVPRSKQCLCHKNRITAWRLRWTWII